MAALAAAGIIAEAAPLLPYLEACAASDECAAQQQQGTQGGSCSMEAEGGGQGPEAAAAAGLRCACRLRLRPLLGG